MQTCQFNAADSRANSQPTEAKTVSCFVFEQWTFELNLLWFTPLCNVRLIATRTAWGTGQGPSGKYSTMCKCLHWSEITSGTSTYRSLLCQPRSDPGPIAVRCYHWRMQRVLATPSKFFHFMQKISCQISRQIIVFLQKIRGLGPPRLNLNLNVCGCLAFTFAECERPLW